MADVGRRLLGEGVEMGLSEVLASLRTLILPPEQRSRVFNVPELDALLPSAPPPAPPLQQPQRSEDDTWDQPPHAQPQVARKVKKAGCHVIELISPPTAHHPSQAGKTSLLHLTITHAVLPASLSSVPLSGLNTALIVIDPLHHFSIPFLATTLLAHITTRFQEAGKDLNSSLIQSEIMQCCKESLQHVHIFRPATWDSLLATLRGLENYLFNGKHASSHRAIHSIIMEDLDAFVPAIRNTPTAANSSNPLATASTQLTHQLEKLSGLLSCAVMLTSRSTTPSSFRPALPLSWPPGMLVTRVAVRRVEVLKFAAQISVEEAERERGQRWEVVGRGRFEVWKPGQGMRDGEGFSLRVGRGVQIERETK